MVGGCFVLIFFIDLEGLTGHACLDRDLLHIVMAVHV